jgi:U4/U6 small nuclear ribonucleoprotein PRP31
MSLADSFLADLEDIESSETVSKPHVSVEESMDVFSWPSILDDLEFQNFISRVSSSTTPASLDRSSAVYILITESTDFIPLIDKDIYSIYRYSADVFAKRFPELEQIVLSPIDYIRVVHRILSISSILDESFSDIGPPNLSVAITVTASTSRGSGSLSSSEQDHLKRVLEISLQLHTIRQSILEFLQNNMPIYAPNLSILLGSFLAAQLVSAAGGLESLATMPSQNIEAVGAHKQASGNKSPLLQCDLLADCTNEDVRKRALRLLVGKTALAARVDRFGSDKQGKTGARFREEILNGIEKKNQLPPAKAVKALPLPEIEKERTRRGGRKARAWKAKYGLTELQKKSDRLQFGQGSGDIAIDGTSVSSGRFEMGAGRIRAIQPVKK